MGKCSRGSCYIDNSREICCAECDELIDCERTCWWVSPDDITADCKYCSDYIEVN